MIQIRVYKNNEVTYLDLFKDAPINLEMSFSEIQDITSKNGAYTKSFDLPGSDTNNLFFEFYYNPQNVTINFDPATRIEADIIFNGYEILTGYLRLMNTVNSDGEVFYQVTFYNETGNLLSKIGDKKLSDLDTTEDFDHTFSWINIYNSWDINASTGTDGLLNGRVLYPLLHRGYRYNQVGQEVSLDTGQTGLFNLSGLQLNSVSRYELDPFTGGGPSITSYGWIRNNYFPLSLQVKALFTSICKQAGFIIESEFFDNNDWFNRIYLPLTFESEDFVTPGLVNEPFSTVSTTNVFFTGTFQTYTYEYTDLVNDPYNLWSTTSDFINTRLGYHQYSVSFDYENTTGGDREMKFEILNNIGVSSKGADFICKANSEENLEFKVWVNLNQIGQLNSLVFKTISGASRSVRLRNIKFQQIKSSRFASPATIDVSNAFGKEHLQVDFISSCMKQFNLCMVPKPNESKTLLIEPVGEFIGRGNTYDWTTKVDRSKKINVTSTNSFINGTVNFKPEVGKDFLNVEYKKGEGNELSFGERKTELNTDFRNSELNIKSKFVIPQSENIEPSVDYTLPVFYQAKDNNVGGETIRNFNPFKTTMNLIYYSGKRNIYLDRGIYMNYFGSISSQATLSNGAWFPQSHHITYFPVATATQNKSISFNKEQKQGLYRQIPIQDDCFTMFYEELLNDYVSEDGRFVEMSIYLTPEEIKEIDFREIVNIDNVSYRINKISDYNLVEGNVCNVELIKVWQDITVFGQEDGTDKIVLNSCGAGVPDIFTTMELSPGLIQLTGRIIKVNQVCYFVEPPTAFDPTIQYVSVTPDNNNGDPLLYESCLDCGETGGGVCDPITDIEPIFDNNASGLYLGTFEYEDDFGNGVDCTITDFYWDCDTNRFTYDEFSGQGDCGSDGWNGVGGTPITIPTPVNRPGYLVDDCCYDPSTGFNYDIYIEIGTANQGRQGDMTMHKICCSIQPTTTTSTTVAPSGFFTIRSCVGTTLYNVDSNGFNLVIGDVYNFTIDTGCDGNPDFTMGCMEVIANATDGSLGCIHSIQDTYDDCNTCLNITTTTTQSPTTGYHIVPCNGDPHSQVYSGQALNTGSTYYMELDNGVSGCFTVGSTTSNPNDAISFLGDEFIDCADCLDPTPTTTTSTTEFPTTTTTTTIPPTTTTTSTIPDPILCSYYTVTAPQESGESYETFYFDCQGNKQKFEIYWTDNAVQFCAQDGSVFSQGPVTQGGPCLG